MGYDISYHPVHPDELQAFLIAPLADETLRATRIEELTSDQRHQHSLRHQVFDRLPSLDALRAGKGALATTVGYAAAIVAGYLHPYWYERGAALSFWARVEPACDTLLSCLAREVPGLGGVPDSGRLPGNSAAGAFVPHRSLEALEALLKKSAKKPEFSESMGNAAALKVAIGYAKHRGLGLLEASEIVDASGTLSWPENLRAAHYKNIKKTTNLRHGRLVRSTRDELLEAVRANWESIEAERLDVLIEPSWQLPDDVLALLATHCPTAQDALARAPATPPSWLEHIAHGPTPRGTPAIDWRRILVARNPSTSVETLEKLLASVKSSNATLLMAIGAHAKATPEMLARILQIPRLPAARLAVAKNPRTPAAILAQLADDSYVEVRKAVARHPNSQSV